MTVDEAVQKLTEQSAYFRTEAAKFRQPYLLGTKTACDPRKGQANPLAYSQNCVVMADFCDRLVKDLSSEAE